MKRIVHIVGSMAPGGIENFIMNYLGIFFLIVGNLFPILTIFLKKQGEKHENFVKG